MYYILNGSASLRLRVNEFDNLLSVDTAFLFVWYKTKPLLLRAWYVKTGKHIERKALEHSYIN